MSTIMPRNPVMAMPNPMGTPRKRMAKRKIMPRIPQAAELSPEGMNPAMGPKIRTQATRAARMDHPHPPCCDDATESLQQFDEHNQGQQKGGQGGQEKEHPHRKLQGLADFTVLESLDPLAHELGGDEEHDQEGDEVDEGLDRIQGAAFELSHHKVDLDVPPSVLFHRGQPEEHEDQHQELLHLDPTRDGIGKGIPEEDIHKHRDGHDAEGRTGNVIEESGGRTHPFFGALPLPRRRILVADLPLPMQKTLKTSLTSCLPIPGTSIALAKER